ncbi:TetR/AcrR family transcriptional regulator [Paenibacillus elgii]|uniref:TetR/AcrR family transcriptional regulator n=1 Tax=Paenibacillus elgii TaxID=189691 RepID=UPI0013CF4C12|nr:TetR/AcrR family transcriptional regulator [Paenibacillus elgii]
MSHSGRAMDRRIKRTRQAIQEALVSLIAEKGFDSLTIQDIIERADINRSTFYYHYEDKQDLLQQSIREMLEQAVTEIESAKNSVQAAGTSFKYNPMPRFVCLFEHIHRNREFYRVMVGHVPGFIWKTIEMIKEHILKDITLLNSDPQKLQVPGPFLAHYAAGALMMVIKGWLDKDLPYSADFMAEQLTKIMRSGLYSVAGIQLSEE